ncbi:hypothetical protein SRHO_G00023490 [Serrasalmus rhombeus]
MQQKVTSHRTLCRIFNKEDLATEALCVCEAECVRTHTDWWAGWGSRVSGPPSSMRENKASLGPIKRAGWLWAPLQKSPARIGGTRGPGPNMRRRQSLYKK